jgi:hypothetical protein
MTCSLVTFSAFDTSNLGRSQYLGTVERGKNHEKLNCYPRRNADPCAEWFGLCWDIDGLRSASCARAASHTTTSLCAPLSPFIPIPDIWLCLHKDGSLFYTDRPPYGLQCQLYAPPVVVIPYVIPYDPAPGHTLPYGSALPGPTPPAALAPSAKAGPNDGAAGKIDFEKFRMLSEGMTESDVLALAGSPGSEYTANCSSSLIPVACPKYWIYTYGGNWAVSVTLLDGRVIGITNDRRP